MNPFTLFRQQFPVTRSHVYMNHAAVSPLPLRCKDAMQSYLEELTRHGAAHYPDAISEPLGEVRGHAARLLGTSPQHVFVIRSTTQGLGIAATGLQVAEGDNVVLVDKEFPANIRPWLPLRRRGVDVRLVPQREGRVRIDDLAAAVDRRTAAVSLSYVQFLSGFRVDLATVAELCRAHDALFVVDGIQGVGVFPIDVEASGVDFLAADSHKWMVGPEGVGVGYASPRAMDRIDPVLEGWLSVERPFDFFDYEQPLKAGAARFEEGAYDVAGLYGLRGSLELLHAVGIEALAERVLALTDRLVDGLRTRGWEVLSPRDEPREKSGIVLTTRAGVDFTQLNRRLAQDGIIVSERGGALRIAPHGYNTEDEVDQVLSTLGRALDS